jgi:hypothetical protein
MTRRKKLVISAAAGVVSLIAIVTTNTHLAAVQPLSFRTVL